MEHPEHCLRERITKGLQGNDAADVF